MITGLLDPRCGGAGELRQFLSEARSRDEYKKHAGVSEQMNSKRFTT